MTKAATATVVILLVAAILQGHTRSLAVPAGEKSAQEISILLLDARNGQPIAKQSVGARFRLEGQSEMRGVTGADGVARIQLPASVPLSASLFVTLGDSEDLWYCFESRSQIEIEKVVRDGVVNARLKRPNAKVCSVDETVRSKVQAKPGQITIFARPITPWEKFLLTVYYRPFFR